MDGDLAQLPALVALAQSHRAILVVDEAHATGVWGLTGRGVCEYFAVEAEVPVRIGTLSKALGSSGGFVAWRRPLIDWLYNRAHSHVFSTAQPAAACAASLAALRVVRDEPQRRIQLLQRAAQLRETLRSQGWCVGPSQSQIVPVMVHPPEHAVMLAEQLREAGILVPAVRPPTVPPGESLLRISVTWLHTRSDLQQLTDRLSELRGRCDEGD